MSQKKKPKNLFHAQSKCHHLNSLASLVYCRAWTFFFFFNKIYIMEKGKTNQSKQISSFIDESGHSTKHIIPSHVIVY